MDATVIVAAMGLAATLLATWLTARSQRRVDREGRILDAKVRTYGECSESLYEYARATYNRSKARIAAQPDRDEEGPRQEAYRANARARSAIGQVLILTKNQELEEELTRARRQIGQLNRAPNHDDLRSRQEVAYQTIKRALDMARSDLVT
ncbi:hypothetical protein [Nocardioides sp. InS609-2]|uniref:hypothetical protein n=1 Tax=Nocardioides sp. InS609-2 TaxID=2760705 RepID=UPI0020C13236|nr:hypothetical protein [Nocardioides sp. InS609-2]